MTLSAPRFVSRGRAATARFTASDVGAGLAGPARGTVPLDTTRTGRRTATVTVADHVRHMASAQARYRVLRNRPQTAFRALCVDARRHRARVVFRGRSGGG